MAPRTLALSKAGSLRVSVLGSPATSAPVIRSHGCSRCHCSDGNRGRDSYGNARTRIIALREQTAPLHLPGVTEGPHPLLRSLANGVRRAAESGLLSLLRSRRTRAEVRYGGRMRCRAGLHMSSVEALGSAADRSVRRDMHTDRPAR